MGALVVGGDYQGLGVVRGLGRQGIPVGVIDDEHSIARFSRYATFGQSTPDLRDEETTVEALLELGRRGPLDGWVLYPTRDETVAAISRHRERLSMFSHPDATMGNGPVDMEQGEHLQDGQHSGHPDAAHLVSAQRP